MVPVEQVLAALIIIKAKLVEQAIAPHPLAVLAPVQILLLLPLPEQQVRLMVRQRTELAVLDHPVVMPRMELVKAAAVAQQVLVMAERAEMEELLFNLLLQVALLIRIFQTMAQKEFCNLQTSPIVPGQFLQLSLL